MDRARRERPGSDDQDRGGPVVEPAFEAARGQRDGAAEPHADEREPGQRAGDVGLVDATRLPIGRRVSSVTAAASARSSPGGRRRHQRAAVVDARGGERRHLVEDRERGAQQRQRERRAAALAEPQLEIEQRMQTELREHEPCPGSEERCAAISEAGSAGASAAATSTAEEAG